MQYFGFDRPSFGIKTFGFGSSEFSPLDIFAGGKQGVWYDPSDKSTLFQDVAGTVPVTKDGDPVGGIDDLSGNGNHALQSVSAARPFYRSDIIKSLSFDGVDDGIKTGVIELSADMDCFIALRINTKKTGILFGSRAGILFGYHQQGGTGASSQGCGSNVTNFINGVQVEGGVSTTGNQLFFAMPLGTWFVLEIRNLDLSAFNLLEISMFINLRPHFDMNALIVCPAQSDVSRTQIRQYLAAKAGVTL